MLLLHCREPLVSPFTFTRLCFPSWSAGCVLRRRLLMSGSSFTPILGFGSRVSPALVSFFSLDYDFLVIIVHVVLLSRCIVRDFSSGRFLQLHLVVVYSDVACWWSLQHCCVVLCHYVIAGPAPVRQFTTTWSADFEETFWDTLLCVVLDPVSLCSPGTLPLQHHCVILDPSVSLTSLAE